MGMQIGSSQEEESLNSTINTTPLVDVMLVLLIIFLITIPVVTSSVQVKLPQEQNAIRESKPENIVISVSPQGKLYYYDYLLKDTEDLKARLRKARDDAKAQNKDQPEVHIRGDANSFYEPVGRIILALQEIGMVKVAFITDPRKE